MSEVAKYCSGIWTRLFDHRPFLNGELKFMLIEFEEKRSDREIENLFSAIQNSTEIKDNEIDRMKKLSSTYTPTLLNKLDVAIKTAEGVLNIEKIKSEDDTLERYREDQKKVWNVFIENMSDKYTRIDNAFEQKEEELKDLYADLEHKLNITTK